MSNTEKGLLSGALLVTLVAALIVGWPGGDSLAREVTVFKSPTCECCVAWVKHLRENGFSVITKDVENVASLKTQLGVSSHLSSCHTATVEGYVLEGHVPADIIMQLLAERPRVAGLTVPGMPMGVPGMEGMPAEHYQVMTFDRQGNTAEFALR